MGVSFENRRERAVESALENERNLYNEYLRNLGITDDDLRDKAVADVGAGSRMFGAHVLREGLTDTMYSIEPDLKGAFPEEQEQLALTITTKLQKKLDELTIEGGREALPLEDESIDLLVNHGAMPGSEWHENQDFSEIRQEIEDSFDEIMRVLRPGGEARLMPLRVIQEGVGGSQWREAILDKLDRMEKDGVSVKIEEANKWRNPGDKEETVDERIILKKPDVRGV